MHHMTKAPQLRGLVRLTKFPLDHMPVCFTGIKPGTWKVRAIWGVGEGLRFKRDANEFIKGGAVFGGHRIGEMLCQIKLQTGFG